MSLEILNAVKWVLSLTFIAIVFLLLFRKEIQQILQRDIKLRWGHKKFDLTNPTRGTIALAIEHITGETKITYVRGKLSTIADELEEIRNTELIVSGTASIFNEAIRLAESAQTRICSLNHRYKVWLQQRHGFYYVYDDYFKAEILRLKNGVQIKRILVIPERHVEDKEVRDLLRQQKEAGVDIEYAIKETLERSVEYQEMLHEYNKRKFGLSFDLVNIAVYDDKVLLHTLACADSPDYIPTRIRITWRDEEVRLFSPCRLLESLSQGITCKP
jgi:hypothetical protein